MLRVLSRLLFVIFLLCTGNSVAQLDSSTVSGKKPFVQKEAVEKIKKGEEYWYVDKPLAKRPARKIKTNPLDSGWANTLGAFFQILFYIIIAAAIVAVLYFIYKNADFFNRTLVNEKEAVHSEIESEEELQNLSYPDLIQTAIKNSDYRLAVRWYYLFVLKELSLKEFISFSKFTTNNEYKDQLADAKGAPDSLSVGFRNIVKFYEYVWFGGVNITKVQFEDIQKRFEEVLKQI